MCVFIFGMMELRHYCEIREREKERERERERERD